MKKIIYIAAAAAALAAVSCTRDLEWKNAVDVADQNLTLTFSCGDLATRADGDETTTVDGVNNENRVNRIDFFIFPLNSEGTVDGSTEYVYSGELVPEAQASDNKYTKVITGDADLKLSEIFPDGATKAMVFAVANYYGKEGITVKTWDDIHALEVGDTFTKDAGEGFGTRWPHPMETNHEELFFVMTGEKEIELKTGQYVIDDTVPLKRLASKVTVEFDYSHSVYTDEKGVTWVPENLLAVKPVQEEARVYLSNAFCHATLGGPQTRTPLIPDGKNGSIYIPRPDRDIFEYAYDFLADATDDQLHYYYTYPYPAAIDANGDNQPYLKLVLPWYGYKNYGTADEFFYKKKEVYYKVVLPSNSITESNKLYQYKVDVRIIGSDTEVEVTGEEYRVKDWLANEAISSSVATGRFISLDIPKDEYDMYSDLAEILFISSGEVEISHLTIYQDDFSSVNSDKIYFINDNDYKKDRTTTDIAGTQLQNWVKIDGTQVKVQHQMNNDYSDKDFDAAPMTFVITLHLKNETSIRFDRTITVTQYPALYVKMEEHFGHVFVNEYGSENNYVNAWDNRGAPNYYNSYNDRFLGSILPQNYQFPSSQQGGGTNPNNYTVYVSNLAGTNWVIGNPTEEVDLDNLISGYRKASAVNSGILVAPSFKIASSYGAIPNGQGLYGVPTYDGAVKRCASYQENGYPAGRWRVPTEAEILFCISLSEYGKIPTLFGGAYYASSGRYYSTSDGDFLEANRASVRCVYDVWYWGEEKSDACYSGDDAQGNKLYNTWGGFQN